MLVGQRRDRLELGRVPKSLVVHLTESDPFNVVLVRYDKPVGDPTRLPVNWIDAPTLEFPDAGVAPWISTISTNEATFSVTSTDVDALIATGQTRALLTVGGVVDSAGEWVNSNA